MENKDINPPKLFRKLFEWYCGSAMVEDLEGDLLELFDYNLQNKSAWRAKLIYASQILSIMTSYTIKKRKRDSSHHAFATGNQIAIMNNYVKTAIRSIAKHKTFSIINIIGLAMGMSVSLLAVATLEKVSLFDDFHANNDTIYRLTTTVTDQNGKRTYASVPHQVSDELSQNFPQIKNVTLIKTGLSGAVETLTREIPLKGFYVTKSFFDTFSFKFISGSPKTSLETPNSIVLTKKSADVLFSDLDPIGQVLTIEKDKSFIVTAIIEDPVNTHLQFEMLALYDHSDGNDNAITVNYRSNYMYLMLNPEDHNDLQQGLESMGEKISNIDLNNELSFKLQRLDDIALGEDLYNEIGPVFSYVGMVVFFSLTFMILLPACFNYINLSIARALKRSKEIGLRKVIGAQKNQVFMQFLAESIVISILSLTGAVALFSLLRTKFLDMLVPGQLSHLDISPRMLVFFLAFGLLTGIISGVVPAAYFSRLNPIDSLRNTIKVGSFTGVSLRKALVVGQFALSLGFIIGVGVIVRQSIFKANYDRGFKQENILLIPLTEDVDNDILKNEFLKESDVASVSFSSHIPGTWLSSSTTVKIVDNEDSLDIGQMFVDTQYIDQLGLTVIDGNKFQSENPEGFENIIVNEQFLRDFGIANYTEATDQVFLLDSHKKGRIIGVLKDFNYEPLREKIRGFMLRHDSKKYAYANVQLNTTNTKKSIEKLETIWDTMGQSKALESRLLHHEIEDAYVYFSNQIVLFVFFSSLAVIISCLGLLGMVVFTLENKIKEIGIRKVMGASKKDLVLLLSNNFLKLMAFAVVIGAPLSYLFYDKLFLRIEYYHQGVGLLEIILGIIVLFTLGYLTIFSQVTKAAQINPVNNLRHE